MSVTAFTLCLRTDIHILCESDYSRCYNDQHSGENASIIR